MQAKSHPFFALFSRLHTLNLDTVFLAECSSGLGPGDDVQHCQPIVSFQKLYILRTVRVEMALVSGDEQCALLGLTITTASNFFVQNST